MVDFFLFLSKKGGKHKNLNQNLQSTGHWLKSLGPVFISRLHKPDEFSLLTLQKGFGRKDLVLLFNISEKGRGGTAILYPESWSHIASWT